MLPLGAPKLRTAAGSLGCAMQTEYLGGFAGATRDERPRQPNMTDMASRGKPTVPSRPLHTSTFGRKFLGNPAMRSS